MSTLSPLFLRDEELERSLDLLRRAALDLERAAMRAAEDRRLDRLDRAILQFVHAAPGITPSELDRLLAVGKQTLSRHIKALRAHGLVAALSDPEDRRTRPLALTAAGEALADRMLAAQKRRLRAAFQRVGPAAVEGFSRVVSELANPDVRRERGLASLVPES